MHGVTVPAPGLSQYRGPVPETPPPVVAVDLTVAPLGGAGTYVAGFVEGLAEADVSWPQRVAVLLARTWTTGHPGAVDSLRSRGYVVDVIDVPKPGSWRARLTRGAALRAALRKHSPEVVFFPRDAAPRIGIPFVMLARNLHRWAEREGSPSPQHRVRAWVMRRSSRRSAARAARVLAVSRSLESSMAGVRVHSIVHHGCSLPEFEREPYGGASPRLVMVANVMSNKGIGTVIEGVSKEIAEGRPWQLDVYGRRVDPVEVERLETRSHELLGRSVLAGPVPADEIGSIYRSAQAVVVGSSFETFCFPLIEGMRSGCVVVAPECELVKELCGDAAVTYVEGDAGSLASALDRARAQMMEYSRRGTEQARSFTWAGTVEKTLAEVRAAA